MPEEKPRDANPFHTAASHRRIPQIRKATQTEGINQEVA